MQLYKIPIHQSRFGMVFVAVGGQHVVSVLQCVAVCCTILQSCIAVFCSVLKCFAVFCSVLQSGFECENTEAFVVGGKTCALQILTLFTCVMSHV